MNTFKRCCECNTLGALGTRFGYYYCLEHFPESEKAYWREMVERYPAYNEYVKAMAEGKE